MRKAILPIYYREQEIPEVNSLEEIEEAGTYAVAGYDRPIYVEPVTDYGKSAFIRQYVSSVFFVGADNRDYYGMKCGEFRRGDR